MASGAGTTLLVETEPNDVLSQAQPLGTLQVADNLQVHGVIGNGTSVDADVDWYRFDVAVPEKVTLTLDAPGVITLFDTDSLATPLGHRLIGQVEGTASAAGATLAIDLLPGVAYYAAVSGGGNRYFHPFLADSGTVGTRGPYDLAIQADNPDSFDPTGGVQVVRSDIPAQGYTSAPLSLNIVLSQPIDVTQDYVTILDANGNDLGPNVVISPDTNDLVVTPTAPLDIGSYQVVALDSNGNQFITLPFAVVGREGHLDPAAAPDDTLATANALGDLTQAGLLQVPGVIGDDPGAPVPANDVDMYRFSVSGPGLNTLTAEAFAGRIGSPLTPDLTLFRLTGATNPDGSPAWQLIAGNGGSQNALLAADGERPLLGDPILFSGLTAGDYVIAVSARGNGSDPVAGLLPGSGGRFDPNRSESAANGSMTGPYVLNLFVQPGSAYRPWVMTSSIVAGSTISGPPVQFSVQFSAPVNLPQLSVLSANMNPATDRFPAFILDAAGHRHDLYLGTYDNTHNVATFGPLDRLTDGTYALHLSGPGGLTDLGGEALTGNDPSGDYVVPFSVTDSPALPPRQILATWQDSADAPNDLGVLFPAETAAGLVIRRDFQGTATAPQDQADYYRFTLPTETNLVLELTGVGLNVPGRPVLLDAQGNPLYAAIDPRDPGNHSISLLLPAGTYTVRVGTWSAASAGDVIYELHIARGSWAENPPPLTSGPVPGYRLRLDSIAPPTPTAPPPSVSPPVVTPPVLNPGVPSGGPQLVLPGSDAPSITATVNPAGNATPGPGVINVPGAFSALATGPLGVVAGPGSTPGASPPRLVLPSGDLTPIGVPAILQGEGVVGSGPSGVGIDRFAPLWRLFFFHLLGGLRIPQLLPGPLLGGDGIPAPEDDGGDESAAVSAPAEAHASVTRARERIDPRAFAAVFALAGGVELGRLATLDRERSRRQTRCGRCGAGVPR